MKKKDTKKIVILIIFALTLIFIWGHSCFPKSTSRAESDAVGNFLLPVFEFFFGEGNVTSHIVRKTAHVVEYFVLGSELALMIVWGWVVKYKDIVHHDSTNDESVPKFFSIKTLSLASILLRALISIGAAFAIAGVDEIIQIFSNRGPGFGDVMLDTAGASGGAIILMVIYLIRTKTLRKSLNSRNKT